MATQVVKEELDREWESLLFTAKKMGISIQEIRIFMSKKKSSSQKDEKAIYSSAMEQNK